MIMTRLIPLLFLLAGCSFTEQDDLEQWMQQAGSGLHGQVEPLPQIEPYKPYQYRGQDLVSPFETNRLQVARKNTAGNLPDTGRPREILENYELDKLKLVGTMLLKSERLGLIQTPEGGIYRVRVGSFIGPNYGIVRSVAETEIKLEETVEDVNGEWVKQDNSLYLLQEQGKTP
jgi:type IV pilus assembly protein PilP